MGKSNGSEKLIDCKIGIQDQILQRDNALKKSADIIVKNFMHYAASEPNKTAVLSKLDDMLKGFTDHDKYIIMAYVFCKLA